MGAVLCIRRTIVGAFVIAVVMGFVGVGHSAAAEPFDETWSYLGRDGTRLYMSWSYEHTLRGLNVPNANSTGQCGLDLQSDNRLGEALASHGQRKNVIRAWFFQSLAQTAPASEGGQRDWTAFDKTLEVAAQQGMKVIVTLADQAGQCGDSGFKDRAWYDSGYQATADPGLLASYRDYVAEVVDRYGSDPRIAFWELVNAPDVRLADGGPCAADAAAVLKAWTLDVAGLIKQNAVQLVSIGSAGGDQCGSAGEDFRTVHNIDPIDLCTYHDDLPGAIPGDAAHGLQSRIDQCTSLARPLVVTEVRVARGSEPEGLPARADAVREKVEAQSAAGVRGFVAWSWASEPSTDPTSYDIGPEDPLLAELEANRAPITSTVTFDAPPGQATELAILSQLAQDPDGDALVIAGVASPPSRGDVTCEATICTYTPGDDVFDGNDEFEVEITDPFGATATGRVRLTIRNPVIVVNARHDGQDADPDDGMCAVAPVPDPPGEPICTLRAAVQHAQLVPGRDEVTLPLGADYELTIEGAHEDEGGTGDLDVWSSDEVTIRQSSGFGRARIVAYDLGDRVFDVHAQARLSLRSVDVIGGTAPDNDNGGGLRIKGGAAEWDSSTQVSLSDVGLYDNSAHDGGAVWLGADQGSWTRLELSRVDVRDNHAENDGGGLWAGGLDPDHGAEVGMSIVESWIEDNRADRDGGGVWIGGTATWAELRDTSNGGQLLIEDNAAGRDGGGLWIGGTDLEFRLDSDEAEDPTAFERNRAGRDGGGLWIGGRNAEVRITDTHLVENEAFSDDVPGRDEEDPEVLDGGDGGGLWIGGSGTDVNIRNVLLSENEATDGGGLWAGGPLEAEPEEDPDDPNDISVRLLDTNVTANDADSVWDDNLQLDLGGRGSGLWFGYVADTYLRNVSVRDNNEDGVAVLGGGVDIGWTTISGNGGHGLVLAGTADIPRAGGGPELTARPMRAVNTTISGNGVDADYGSGVHVAGVEDANEPVHAELVHATITENQAAVTGVGGTITAVSSLLARNLDDECSGLVQSLGHNLVGPLCVGEFAEGDVNYDDLDGGVDSIGLGPLEDNGGLSEWHRDGGWDEVVWEDEFRAEHDGNLRTHAPLDATSPVIDAADPDTCLRTDQRQVVRPLGSACDIGALEWAEALAEAQVWNAGSWSVPADSEFEILPTVSNLGPDPIDNVTVEAVLAEGFAFVSSEECDYASDRHVAICQFSNIEPWHDAGAEIRVRSAATAGTYESRLVITTLSPEDPNPNPYHEDITWLSVYEETDPDPDPTFTDTDEDGIHDTIDNDPGTASSHFRHGIGDGSGPLTIGEIRNRWGHLVTAQPDPARPDPEDARVRMDVIGTLQSTNLPAELDVCGSRMYMRPLSAVIVRCGSLIVDVVDAEEPVTVEVSDGTTIALTEGVSAYVNDDENGTVIVEHRGGDEPITITLPDGTTLILPLEAGAELTRSEDGVYTVTHLGGGESIEVLDQDGNPIGTIGPEGSADTTPPVVTLTGVSDGATYTYGSVPNVACSTIDEGSGVQVAAQPAITGGAVDGTGLHTATCDGATDWAGNTAEPVSVSYTVQPSPVQECAGKRATIVGPAVGGAVTGTSGNDVIWVPAGNHTINAGNGNDTICAGPGDKVIDAGAGNDIVYAGDGINTIKGGAGNDTITSGNGDDVIHGDAGNDTIRAGAGGDEIHGDAANDQLYGEDGDDTIIGGDGNDRLEGGPGINTLDGNAGNNTCVLGGDGTTTFNCKV